MWALIREDGSVFRADYPDQWAACRVALNADGKRFHKEESLKLESGTTVYRVCEQSRMFYGHDVGKDGSVGPDYAKKKSIKVKIPYTLVELS